jgi:hypothetical protein
MVLTTYSKFKPGIQDQHAQELEKRMQLAARSLQDKHTYFLMILHGGVTFGSPQCTQRRTLQWEEIAALEEPHTVHCLVKGRPCSLCAAHDE